MPAAAQTPAKVVAAAAAEFGRRGYEATSLDAIAAASGVRKQTILYHFGDKEGLLAAVIDDAAAAIAHALDSGLGSAGETHGWERVEVVVRSVFRTATRRPALLGLVREVSRLGPPHATRLTTAMEPLVARATGFFRREMDAGRMREQDPRLVLLAAYSTIVGAASEVEVLRTFGYPPTARSVVQRRRDLLAFLRDALAP